MKVYQDLDIGAATHTGRVRRTNEDDYLLLMPSDRAELSRSGRLIAVADGMGGITGGAEASRAAVRALAASFQDGDGQPDPTERIRLGFERACRTVFDLSIESPGLRGMGTTLTAVSIVGRQLALGHIGDSRCYLLRGGALEQLTTDHSTQEGGNRLTRCVGGGRASEEVDLVVRTLKAGDRLLLATDGLWNTVPTPDLLHVAGALSPQAAADELVRLANEEGGPDNCTVVVVDVVQLDELGELREVVVPDEEATRPLALPPVPPAILAPRWPWLALALSAVLGGLAFAKAVYGLDLIGMLM